jgi:type VI secretion system protein ImpE
MHNFRGAKGNYREVAMNAKEHYHAGNLTEAIAAATEDVRRHPRDANPRGLLCELLCFAGDFQRADLQLDALVQQDPQLQLGVSMFRQLLRAATARQQCHGEGRLPEFLGLPPPRLQNHLQATICLRDGQPAQAVEKLADAEQQRPQLSGACNGQAFDGFRDVDDLTASFFEVLTSNGKYYWIPMERVERIEFRRPERPRDLLWRRAEMVVNGGPTGEVFLPALYPNSHTDADERVRLGRGTDWRGGDGPPRCGVGQRLFLAGDEARGILEIEEIVIANSVAGEPDAATSA